MTFCLLPLSIKDVQRKDTQLNNIQYNNILLISTQHNRLNGNTQKKGHSEDTQHNYIHHIGSVVMQTVVC